MQKGCDLYLSDYNFKYFIPLLSAFSYQANWQQTTQFSHFVILVIA